MNYPYIFESSCPGGRIEYADTNVAMYNYILCFSASYFLSRAKMNAVPTRTLPFSNPGPYCRQVLTPGLEVK